MVLSVIALLSLLYLALYAIVQNAQKHIAEETQQREMAQQALASSEERWKFALEGSDAGVWDRNLQTGEVVYSRRYREIYGYGEDQLIDHWETWEDRVHPDDLPLVTADREAYLTGKTETYSNERRMRCQDGSWKWILSRGMVVSRDAQGRPVRMIGTHTDISERKAAQQRLQMLAHFDLLTGLPNRGLFSDRLRHGLAKARRDKTGLALMMIDLDEFKPVNDLYGHQIGDLLLKEVATRMLACVRRETDTVARLGGDEFVVILSEVEQARDATTVAETIRDALHQTFDIGGRLINISSCIGVAIFPEHGPDEALLIKSADVAMYRAKENGRNRVELA
jgi:diguanylate cyclase (GGDEF)-like protein/PAS domain S-box-containing protein